MGLYRRLTPAEAATSQPARPKTPTPTPTPAKKPPPPAKKAAPKLPRAANAPHRAKEKATPPKTSRRGRPRAPDKMEVYNLRLKDEQRDKVDGKGGGKWIRELIDKA